MKKKRQGFTLIELLAVIVILGLLMAIAIPSVTKYITQSRKKTLTTTIGNYISALTNEVNDMNYIFTEANTIYAVPIECIAVERGGTNPFGEWMQASDSYWAYVLVQYDDATSSYTYGFTFKDSAGYGLYPTTSEKLNESGSQIQTGLEDLNMPKHGFYSQIALKEKWNGFYLKNNTMVKVLISETDGVAGDGENTCTLAQKGSNYAEIEEEKNKPTYVINDGRTSNMVFGKEMERSSIEAIYTKKSTFIPASAIEYWDASQQKNEKVVAWIEDTDKDSLYELYLGQDGGVIAPGNSGYLFSIFNNVTYMDLSNFKTHNVYGMAGMFYGCSKIENLDLSNFDTSQVTVTGAMFNVCTNLKSLNLSSFNTQKVANAGMMFRDLPNLTTIDLSSFETPNLKDMGWFLAGNTKLTTIDIRKMTFDKVTSYSSSFSNIKADTKIIVKSEKEKNWLLTNANANFNNIVIAN